MNRTIQALRQVVLATLTSPALVYQINNGSPITLPVNNVGTRSSWSPSDGTPPSPLIAISVGAMAPPFRSTSERRLTLTVQISSSTDDDEVTELYEACRARLQLADNDGPSDAPTDISRAATSSILGIAIRECTETHVSPAAFDPTTARFYLTAEYSVRAA